MRNSGQKPRVETASLSNESKLAEAKRGRYEEPRVLLIYLFAAADATGIACQSV